MASMVTNLLGGSVIKGVTEGVRDIVTLFKIPPEQQAANALELARIQAEMTASAQKAAQAQIDDATANIQAEAKAGSKARPLFMYIIEFILLFNFIVAPIVNMILKIAHLGSEYALTTLPLPGNLLMLFGVCLTGYTAFDKVKEIMDIPGESKIEIPGLKIGNKN